MTDIKPYIIITSGATGSGKSTIWQLIQKKYNLNANINSVLIDDLIESNKNYKDLVDAIIKKYCTNIELCDELKNKIINPDSEILKNFHNIYYKIRKGEYCENQQSVKVICEHLNDTILLSYIKDNKNILFETTGENNINWLFEPKINNMQTDILDNYDIYHIFIKASCDILINRNKTRAIDQFQKYISNKEKGPRLPDISPKIFNEKIKKIESNFEYYKNYYNSLNGNIKLLEVNGDIDKEKLNSDNIKEVINKSKNILGGSQIIKSSKNIKKKSSKNIKKKSSTQK
jgi:hypothetical protein